MTALLFPNAILIIPVILVVSMYADEEYQTVSLPLLIQHKTNIIYSIRIINKCKFQVVNKSEYIKIKRRNCFRAQSHHKCVIGIVCECDKVKKLTQPA